MNLAATISMYAGGPGSGRHPWSTHAKQFVAVAKKHGLVSNLASPKEKDFYSQGGSISSPGKGGAIHVYGDGSWAHQAGKVWSGRHGTLPSADVGRGYGAQELDEHLMKLKGVK